MGHFLFLHLVTLRPPLKRVNIFGKQFSINLIWKLAFTLAVAEQIKVNDVDVNNDVSNVDDDFDGEKVSPFYEQKNCFLPTFVEAWLDHRRLYRRRDLDDG